MKFTRTRVAGVKPMPLTVTLNALVTFPAINGFGTPVTLVNVGGAVPTVNGSEAESAKSPEGPRFLTRICTVPVVTSKDAGTVAFNRVWLLTLVGTCDSEKTKTVPVVNLLMFPVKMFPVNVVGAMKLLPSTDTGRF